MKKQPKESEQLPPPPPPVSQSEVGQVGEAASGVLDHHLFSLVRAKETLERLEEMAFWVECDNLKPELAALRMAAQHHVHGLADGVKKWTV